MQLNGKLLELVKAGGAIVLAGILAWMYFTTVGNHIEHNTQALQDLNISIREMNTLHIEQSRILERLERVLDK